MAAFAGNRAGTARDKDKEAAIDMIEALFNWIVEQKGFLPDDPRPHSN